MTQTSRFWNGLVTGDATSSPYDAHTEFAQVLAALGGLSGRNNRFGVVRQGYYTTTSGELAVTGTTSPVSIAPGEAFIAGTWYGNTAAISQAVASPSVSTRYDLIGLVKDWTAQTVRVFYRAGTEGNTEAVALATLVRTYGTTWEAPLAVVKITTGGVVTIIDQREYVQADGTLYERVLTEAAASIVIDADALLMGSLFYKNLELILRARTDGSPAAIDNVAMQFNADTGTNYGYAHLSGDSNQADSLLVQTTDSIRIPAIANALFGANVFGIARLLISNFPATSYRSVTGTVSVMNTAASGTGYQTAVVNGIWESVAALTTITLTPVAGSQFEIGTYVCLRGTPS